MTYGHQIAVARHPIARPSGRKYARKRRRAITYRALKRSLHFIGFLLFWASVVALSYTATVAVLIVFVLMS